MNVILLIALLKLLWIGTALLQARFEGHYQDYTYRQDLGHPNLHFIFDGIRGTFLIALVWISWYNLYWVNSAIFGLSCFMSYSFFHNGMLYTTRNKLAPEIYKKRWWANKEVEKTKDRKAAKVEISVGFRIAMLIVAMFFLLGIILDTL